MRTNPSRWRASRRGPAFAVDVSSPFVVVVIGEDMIWSGFGGLRAHQKRAPSPSSVSLEN